MSHTVLPVHPRSQRVRARILEAAVHLLIERGYAGTSIEAVAAKAEVSKTTIYRWWGSWAALSVDGIFALVDVDFHMPELGSAQADFRAQITELAKQLRGRPGRALIALWCGAQTDIKLASELESRWLEPRKRWAETRISRARNDGELRDGVTPATAIALLYGPLCSSVIFSDGRDQVELTTDHLDLAFAAIFR